jgi:hypothetical protein
MIKPALQPPRMRCVNGFAPQALARSWQQESSALRLQFPWDYPSMAE